MLNILTPGSEPDATVMRAMFAARKSVFVDLLKWDVPVLDGQYEIDQFDNVHARYLVLTDPDGNHLASARLLPTTREGILSGLFRKLCDGPVPSAPDILEITRFCLDRRLRAGSDARRAMRWCWRSSTTRWPTALRSTAPSRSWDGCARSWISDGTAARSDHLAR
jgi:N-acyl-L-homoserine lactone synthetase